MRIVRHWAIGLAPFIIGLLLGFLAVPSDGQAKERGDFAGISQMSDIRCQTVANRVERAIFMTAFRYHNFRLFLAKDCDAHFASTPSLERLPAAAFGYMRRHFRPDRQPDM